MNGTQEWNVKIEVNLGYAGPWDKEELLETVREALDGYEGLTVVDAAAVVALQPSNVLGRAVAGIAGETQGLQKPGAAKPDGTEG